MNLLNKIHITNATYIVLLFSLLAGYFEYVFLLLLFIIIHELGHLIMASFFKFNISGVVIYPFGGLVKFNNLINTSINKELLVSISGFIFQLLFYMILFYINSLGYINDYTFEKIRLINYFLILFNILPIIPLDGSKILSLILYKFFGFKTVDKFLVVLSFALIIIISFIVRKVFIVVLLLLLIKSIYFEYKNLKYKYNKFLLERVLYTFSFKRVKKIDNINKMYKDRFHYINGESESVYLPKMFDLEGYL